LPSSRRSKMRGRQIASLILLVMLLVSVIAYIVIVLVR